jgi:hypothetical protein
LTKAYLCPVDQSALVMSERQGIEIDYCPACRGIWLDRGELDKIIERSRPAETSAAAPAAAPPPVPGYGRAQPAGDYRHYGHGKRKKSFLEELFD